jgi:hypothetical protein
MKPFFPLLLACYITRVLYLLLADILNEGPRWKNIINTFFMFSILASLCDYAFS